MKNRENLWHKIWLVETIVCLIVCITGLVLCLVPNVPTLARRICTWISIILLVDVTYFSGIFYGIRYARALKNNDGEKE